MKKYLILILAIATMALYAGTSMAWMNATMLGGGVEAAAPAVSYIFEEDFDASGDCYSGDSTYNNCDNEWTNPDVSQVNFQASGLDGTYGVDIDADGSDYDYISIAITDTSHAYGYFIVNYDTMSASTTRTLFEIKGNNGTVTIFKITVAWDEEPSVYLGAVGDENTDADLSAATTYHIWWEYQKETVAENDAVGRVWISENSTKPGTATCEVTTGTSEHDADLLIFNSYDGEGDGIYDKIRVDDEQIGSSPQ